MRRFVLVALSIAFCTSIAFAGDCPSDVNGDGVVNVSDLTAVITLWGSDDPAADIDGDGVVSTPDLIAVITDWGCEISDDPTTPITGTVINTLTGGPLEGATVSAGGEQFVTDSSGFYTGLVPSGQVMVSFSAAYFDTYEETIIAFPDVPVTLNAGLDPVAAVVVEVVVSGETTPGGVAMATANVIPLDGSTVTGFSWTQIGGVEVGITGENTDTVTVDLPDRLTYKDDLILRLMEPPITEEQLPPNVPLPPGEFPGGLQDRFQVVGVNPFALEETGAVALEVDVTTTSGVYAAEGDIHTTIPWRRAAGIRDVPLEVPVLLHGKTQESYAWMLSKPAASSSVLIDETTQSPDFTPDVSGIYEVTVMDTVAGSPVTLKIYAGNWRGIITGEDDDGRPIADDTCVSCHELLGFERFTPWSGTGHAEIFTDNLNSSPYWGPQCFSCHSVGYDLTANNGGLDEAADYQGFLDSGLIGAQDPNSWSNMLDFFPSSALLANIQCENCHGPQWSLAGVNTLAHGPSNPDGEPRVSLSSDVCATCHGEPLRHARFQQWQLSGHANYEVAIDESESGSCSRCHTANGFLAWLPVLTGAVPGDPLDNVEVTWTPDEAHPQTCVACHDPHMSGTTSGIDNNATVRISGNTPPLIAGFTAYGVGRGAICMTCHNSRRGLRNDDTFDEFYGTSEAARAPHGSAQTDVLMGENAYLVDTGIRGGHSFLTDTCATCHMEETVPPTDLAYNLGGTNHTFYASDSICTNCHTGMDGPSIQAGVQDTLDVLQGLIEDGLFALIDELTTAGNTIDLDEVVQITSASEVADIEFGEFRGRQSMTITFTDDMVLGPFRMTDVTVFDADMMDIGGFYDFAEPNLIKAGWNWNLINNDGSLGVHNPSYAYWIMNASITALNPAAAQTIAWPEWANLPSEPGVSRK